ncbi:hypothetical protein C8R44DRAFT_889408 [Mycena epipterygia]|nr:hypothetical protein C8R44DRAFT_889408 [Mycena epipterygia]
MLFLFPYLRRFVSGIADARLVGAAQARISLQRTTSAQATPSSSTTPPSPAPDPAPGGTPAPPRTLTLPLPTPIRPLHLPLLHLRLLKRRHKKEVVAPTLAAPRRDEGLDERRGVGLHVAHEAELFKRFGKGWGHPPPFPPPTPAAHAAHARLLSRFLDAPGASFGVHRMAPAGKDVGMWFGQSSAASATGCVACSTVDSLSPWERYTFFRGRDCQDVYTTHIVPFAFPALLLPRLVPSPHPHPPLPSVAVRSPPSLTPTRTLIFSAPPYLVPFSYLIRPSSHPTPSHIDAFFLSRILADAFPACGLGDVSVATDGTFYQTEVYAASRSAAAPSSALGYSSSRLSSSRH